MKQFLRHIFLLVAMFVATANAWAADCTIVETYSDVTAIADGKWNSYKPFGKINLCSTRSNLKILSISLSVKMDNEGTQGFEGILKTNNGETLGECEVGRNQTKEYTFQVNKSGISSFILDASDKTYSKKRTVQISNIKVVYECAPSFDKDIVNVTLDDTPVGQTSTKTVLIGYQSTATIVTLLSSEVSDDKDFFSISPSTESVKTGSGTVEYTISFAPTSSVQGATAQYIIKGEGETKVTINVTGTSFDVVAPIHTWKQGVATTYKVGDPNLDLANIWTSKSSGSITYRIKENSFKPSGTNNEGATSPSIYGNVLTLGQAGTLVIEMVQDATTGFYAKTSEQTITINKYGVDAFISQSSALRNEIIDNPFSLSYGLIDFDVESKNTNIAEYHKDTKKIQTYFTDGTASFQITRPEDYKYNKLDKTLSLEVQPAGGCLVLEPCSGSYSAASFGSYEPAGFKGVPNQLTFKAENQYVAGLAGRGSIVVQQYLNNGWTDITSIAWEELGKDYDSEGLKPFGPYNLDEKATKVRFYTRNGTYERYFKDVQVTRKTYLRPSTTELTLPQTNIGKSSEKTFDLSWSTCSNDIKLVSNNDLFEVGTTQINTTAHTGTTNNILVRFKGANEPGTYSAVITIYDQSQSKEVHVSCNVKDRLTTKIVYTGESQYSEAHDCIKGLFSVIDNETGNTITGANIVLTSSNNDILEICDNAGFMPHCGGPVTLTANYAGDEIYAPAEWSREITVANCYQTIDWEQDFRQFIAAEDGTISQRIELTAKAVPTDFAITYELDEAAQKFARLEKQNGQWFLVIFGVGTGHIIATSPAGTFETKYYDETSLMHEIRVHKWGEKCNTDEILTTHEVTLSEVLIWLPTEKVFTLEGRPYARLEFYSHVSNESLNNDLTVSFSTDGGSTWTNSKTFNDIPKTYNWNTPYVHDNIPEGANRVKFSTNSTTNTYFNMVKMVQKTYLEPNVTEIRIDDAIVNQQFIREFKVKYSDIPLLQYVISDLHDLGLKLTSTPAIANDCGDWGEYTFTLTGESPYPQSNVTETITFYTSAGDVVNIPVTITATLSEPFYFNVQDGDMAVSSNWTYNGSNTHGLLPDKRFPIIVSQAMTINEGELVAYGVTIENGGSVNIQPKGGLTLHAGGFTNVTENNFEVQNNKEGAGYVRVSKYFKKLGGQMPKMKVHFTTKANMKNGGNKDAAWQYIGAPGAETQMQVVNTSTLYLRSEEKGWVRQWDSNASLTPFAGYAFTQKDQPSIDFTPRLVTDNQTITLTYTEGGMKGDNLWANSYMAPIDIKKLGKEDFSGAVDQIVYLYNCGSWNEWNKDQSAIQTAEELPGRYYAIPVGSARALDATYDQTVIPPMQGVYMVANSGGGSLTLNYEKHVWNCESNEMNRALRIAGKRTAEEDYLSSILRIRLQINSQNSGADRMYLIQDSTCTANYDNGFDAPKQMTDGLLNLYTNEACGKMEISATDNIDGIYLGFAAGEDEVYTMTFTSLIGEDLYLYDVEQDTLVGMANGETYEFAAAAKSTNDMRFQILVNPELSDYLPNGGNGDGVTTDIYDVQTQQLWVQDKKVYIAYASANNTLEVYTISGVAVAKYAIGYAPCTLDLSNMPTGVYMLRLNDTVYKFVCK